MAPSPSLTGFGNLLVAALGAVGVMVAEIVTTSKGLIAEDARVRLEAGMTQMMSLEMVDAGETSLADGATEVFLGRLGFCRHYG